MSTEEVEAIMKEADLNRDGRLDYAEVSLHALFYNTQIIE